MKKLISIVLITTMFFGLVSCGFDMHSISTETKEYDEVDGISLLDFLRENISCDNTVEEIMDVFEEMCKTPLEDDILLLEYGVYNFTGEILFYYDLVRQYPDGNGEYYQIRVSLAFAPDIKNFFLNKTIWSDETEEDFFAYIRKSSGYRYAKDNKIKSIDIRIDHT